MAKFHDVIHNTPEWFLARAGVATASSFDKIITKTGKLSAQADAYACKLIAELLLGKSFDRDLSVWALEWGREHEADAANMYSFETGLDVIHGGFWTNDELTMGASPDVIVMDIDKQVGIAEIKCPEDPAVHVDFLLQKQLNPKYKPQVYGQLYVTGFDWCDWFSYYPSMPCNRVRVHRDDDPDFMAELVQAMQGFEKLLRSKLDRLQELGHIEEIPKKLIKSRTQKKEDQNEDYIMAG